MKTESRPPAGVIHTEPAEASQRITRLLRHEATKPHLYVFILSVWVAAMCWFGPRLWSLLDLADNAFGAGAIVFFIVFMQVAWLYAFYNVGILIFARYYRKRYADFYTVDVPMPSDAPAVALLYTTRNDYVEAVAEACLRVEYHDYKLYILDDSTLPEYMKRIDAFASLYPDRVQVIRRPDRIGFKAGNLNNALTHYVHEPLFVLVDADEILPPDFLTKLVPRILGDENCAYIQANHRVNPSQDSAFAKSMGLGVDIHWRWYQPLRNRYGFVMLLGHGAIVRRSCWEAAGGFPPLVAEDLAFSIAIREKGFKGLFAEDVMCLEDFPENGRAFRVRHMKWTRGTCEFLAKMGGRLLRAKTMSWVEKLDILFPTVNLPLCLFYFLFIIDANLVLTMMFGHAAPLTIQGGSNELVINNYVDAATLGRLAGPDFYAITLLTVSSPVLCFMIDLWRKPGVLLAFLSRSTAVYGALTPLSCLGVVFYAITRKAVFHVTADRANAGVATERPSFWKGIQNGWRKLLDGSHPDHLFVQGFEFCTGLFFAVLCLYRFQVAFLGLSLGFMLLPFIHRVRWNHPILRRAVHLPFVFIIVGMMLSAMAVAGMQTVFFGYGFHF